jgi:hypothetical protein
MKTALVAISILTAFGLKAQAADVENRVGKIYPIGKDPVGSPLFTQKIRIEKTGDGRRTNSTIEDADRKIVMTEVAVFNGDDIVEQTVEQLQIQERYELRVKDGKVTYRTFKLEADGSKLKKESSEAVPKHFLTGPGTDIFLKSHEGEFASGKTVKGNFGVFEVSRAVEFSFKAESRNPASGSNLKIRMSPSSFWLSLLVSAIDLELDPKTFRLMRYKGRTPVRVKSGSSWKPLDAEIIYSTVDAKK